MSIYATFFVLAEHEEHERDCARHTAEPTEEHVVYWNDGTRSGYGPDLPCTCSALGGPYRYDMSNRSIEGPDHPRSGAVMCCRAVGTWTMRLSVSSEPSKGKPQDATVLLDRRQVEAMRDALTRFLDYWSDPAGYMREGAYDAALPITPEQLAERERRNAELEALVERLRHAKAVSE